MHNPRPGEEFTETFLTYVAIAEQDPAGADQPEIVQCLDNRDSLCARRVVAGRRHQGVGIMEMHDVRLQAERVEEILQRAVRDRRA